MIKIFVIKLLNKSSALYSQFMSSFFRDKFTGTSSIPENGIKEISGSSELINEIAVSNNVDNSRHSNLILSFNVDISTIQGHNIEVRENTYIDVFSQVSSYTYIGYSCFITKSQIGRYVSIANNVSIGLGEHKLDRISTSSLFYDNPYETLTEKECIIGNDVWIGVDSIVRRGVRIGDGAVVGANSFVTKDVPDFAVVVGNPAKILKYRFEDKIQNLIRDSKWWLLDINEAKRIHLELINKISTIPSSGQ